MRRFTSYGPVNPKKHFCVKRRQLVEDCIDHLVGDEEEGHYFTMWGPRQTGKTWLMRQARAEIEARHSDRFLIRSLSMQGVTLDPDAPTDAFLDRVPGLFKRWLGLSVNVPGSWDEWTSYFMKDSPVFDRPLLLFIDEFDKLPINIIDRLVELFRDIYLNEETSLLHGLALIGVRAVLGVDSRQGSPFNVQRSLQVSNLSSDEVRELYQQYQDESGQAIEPEVVEEIYESVQGQPGLTCWFGELLTQRFNREPGHPIGMAQWRHVYARALHTERNNNIRNLEAKARATYASEVQTLFVKSDVPYSVGQPWCDYLDLNGIIREKCIDENGTDPTFVCQFASPFVQRRLFNAFTQDLYGDGGSVLALEPGDLLSDVFTPKEINLPALLTRYKSYLTRLNARGFDPWGGHPRRKTDLNLPEAIGHFHLYAWLQNAIGRRTVISPEFPTGNGKVDLVVRHDDRIGLIEVKSFRDSYELRKSYGKTAEYARNLGVDTVTMAVFVPLHDEADLEQVSGEFIQGGVRIVVVAIGWG